ncbi:hypothetical protein NP493_366g02051 [Ridgeia piscesae]|uniref:Uncharacterized protein n=1 Tax=Ridgeia piscesae TaxID=27915 RepID=A0AAD9L314_RIDPI|nr:hypothetical protein NP493_366g02051 [Ridgeia piscesae]
MGGKTVSGSVRFVKSLYNDPFRWQVVKSVSFFALGVYLAVEIANADLSEPA